MNTWLEEQMKMVFYGYPKEYLINRGLIPFADWIDWGLLCFNTNEQSPDNNYPIVIWDHEKPYEHEYFSSDFNFKVFYIFMKQLMPYFSFNRL